MQDESGMVMFEDGTILSNVHRRDQCMSKHCPIHNPSDHHMREWPQRWREGFMWRECPHGHLHPDPDEPREWNGPEVFSIMEAVPSVALSHDDECGCDVCLAAGGDTEAMGRCIVMFDPHASCDGCCDA